MIGGGGVVDKTHFCQGAAAKLVQDSPGLKCTQIWIQRRMGLSAVGEWTRTADGLTAPTKLRCQKCA